MGYGKRRDGKRRDCCRGRNLSWGNFSMFLSRDRTKRVDMNAGAGQVPENLRGFEDRHEGRLLTVFTASNYCGSTGNYGAVVVFQSDLSFSVEEHMAPDLELVVRDYLPEGSRVVADIGGTKVSVDKGRLAGAMHEEVIGKLKERIALAKDDLWWYWSRVDRNDTGKVSAAVWRQGMISGLQLDLPWFSLQKDLVDVDEDGYVDYKAFLHKSRVVDAQAAMPSMHEGWEREMVNKAYEAFLAKDMTLQEVPPGPAPPGRTSLRLPHVRTRRELLGTGRGRRTGRAWA